MDVSSLFFGAKLQIIFYVYTEYHGSKVQNETKESVKTYDFHIYTTKRAQRDDAYIFARKHLLYGLNIENILNGIRFNHAYCVRLLFANHACHGNFWCGISTAQSRRHMREAIYPNGYSGEKHT